jgi:hypothetical protein
MTRQASVDLLDGLRSSSNSRERFMLKQGDDSPQTSFLTPGGSGTTVEMNRRARKPPVDVIEAACGKLQHLNKSSVDVLLRDKRQDAERGG